MFDIIIRQSVVLQKGCPVGWRVENRSALPRRQDRDGSGVRSVGLPVGRVDRSNPVRGPGREGFKETERAPPMQLYRVVAGETVNGAPIKIDADVALCRWLPLHDRATPQE